MRRYVLSVLLIAMTIFVIGGVATTHIESAEIQGYELVRTRRTVSKADSIFTADSIYQDKNVATNTCYPSGTACHLPFLRQGRSSVASIISPLDKVASETPPLDKNVASETPPLDKGRCPKGGGVETTQTKEATQKKENPQAPDTTQSTDNQASTESTQVLESLAFDSLKAVRSAAYVTDYGGAPIQFITYRPYGEINDNRASSYYSYDERYKFTGKERDSETGYDYLTLLSTGCASAILASGIAFDLHRTLKPATTHQHCRYGSQWRG